MDLGKALSAGLLDQKAGPKPSQDEDDSTGDLEILYGEFKNAKTDADGVRALKLLMGKLRD